MSGIRHVDSSTTWDMFNTGGSTNLYTQTNRHILKILAIHYSVAYFEPRLLMMKVVTQKGTLSCLSDLTRSILWSSLHEFSHSPGSGVASGSEEVYHWCQSRGYWSNELAIPIKLAILEVEWMYETQYNMHTTYSVVLKLEQYLQFW